mmetsp:Transcript_36905/g.78343  ORF Transcript_36905/g.78343 Transcript_36905/m.78343 type:complete len:203 (+) Transcript_36905:62-670(+)
MALPPPTDVDGSHRATMESRLDLREGSSSVGGCWSAAHADRRTLDGKDVIVASTGVKQIVESAVCAGLNDGTGNTEGVASLVPTTRKLYLRCNPLPPLHDARRKLPVDFHEIGRWHFGKLKRRHRSSRHPRSARQPSCGCIILRNHPTAKLDGSTKPTNAKLFAGAFQIDVFAIAEHCCPPHAGSLLSDDSAYLIDQLLQSV